jgi:nucleotide-binding universal stress UspA family protein
MKFIVCLDDSNTSRAALVLAVKYAAVFNADLTLVTSLSKGTENETKKIKEAEIRLNDFKNTYEKDGLSCDAHLLIRGLSAGEDLVDFAREQKADQIFIGVKRRSKVEKLVFGSTAQYVILHADCPVVTVK